jgi:hypothetical protein
MAPPDKDIDIFEMIESLAWVVETDRFYLKTWDGPEVFGDLIAQPVWVGFFLSRLTLIPDPNSNRFRAE